MKRYPDENPTKKSGFKTKFAKGAGDYSLLSKKTTDVLSGVSYRRPLMVWDSAIRGERGDLRTKITLYVRPHLGLELMDGKEGKYSEGLFVCYN